MHLSWVYLGNLISVAAAYYDCPVWTKYGSAPPSMCEPVTDPQNRPRSMLESWFDKSMFADLFPKANLGWGISTCKPYSYEAFAIAARYFPKFGAEHFEKDPTGKPLITAYTAYDTYRRDVAAFFAHVVEETGENDVKLYVTLPTQQAHDCFYRGGLFNWFEGGPNSTLLKNGGLDPSDGAFCTAAAQYCNQGSNNKWLYPCSTETSGAWYKGCYFGRGAIQIPYSHNYGLFQRWLQEQKILHNGKLIDILQEPNLIMTKRDPPLSFLASFWFYMTPQSPKPSMHDIVVGNWVSPDPSYAGGVFEPTSLVLGNECGGEDSTEPGRSGESRRIKAFRWFNNYFRSTFLMGDPKTLSCKLFNGGSQKFDFPGRKVMNSWDANWMTSWDSSKPCECVMQTYQGYIPAYDPVIMPHYASQNAANKKWCETSCQTGWQNLLCANYRG